MTKPTIFLTLFLTCFTFPSVAQHVTVEDILGKWVLYRHTFDSTLMYDADNPQVMTNYNLLKLKQLKPDYTTEDSLMVIKNIDSSRDGFKKIFIQFNQNGTYTNTKIIRGGIITDEIEGGKYSFDEVEQTLMQTDQRDRTLSMKVFFNNNILKLVMLKSIPSEMEYRKQ